MSKNDPGPGPERRPNRAHVTKTRVVFPKDSGDPVEFDHRLEHHVGDPMTLADRDGDWFVFDRYVEGNMMVLLVRPAR